MVFDVFRRVVGFAGVFQLLLYDPSSFSTAHQKNENNDANNNVYASNASSYHHSFVEFRFVSLRMRRTPEGKSWHYDYVVELLRSIEGREKEVPRNVCDRVELYSIKQR